MKGTYMGDNAKKKGMISNEERARQDCEKAGITDPEFIKEWETYQYRRRVKMAPGTKKDTIQEHYAKWKQKRDNGTAPEVISKELKTPVVISKELMDETTAPAQESVDTEPEPDPDDYDDDETETTDEKPSNLKWWLIGGIGGALLITAIVVIIIVVKRKK